MEKYNIFWFRRDLRIDDNTALSAASSSKIPVLPIFIFDSNITDKLPVDDRRINFIYDQLVKLNKVLISDYNSLLNDKLDLDYVETLIREKFLFGKEGETLYLIKENDN